MNKNFKRVISTVAALAMAASSFVAMAATYPDVTADSNYYSAIEQLSALGIIDGFDDGTFKPDEKVTRAQMAKLVVGAKNMLAEAEGNTRKIFDDVAPGKSEWAMGYVAQAYEEEIINGTSKTTFDPDATVTYMQAMKMLVNAAGYESWAQDEGGWPEGYRYWGRELEIGKGITGVNDDTEMTRGQIAQMIANAMRAPMLGLVGYNRDNGEKYAVYEQLDGKKGKDFKSLLTEEWETYEAYGRVTATSRQGGSLKAGQVNFKVEKSENYDDVKYPYTATVSGSTTTVYGNAKAADATGTDAENLLLEYAYALINVNEDDDAKIVYIESATKNKTVEFDSDLNAGITGTTLRVYKNENTTSTTKYTLAPASELKVIINGVEFDSYYDAIGDYTDVDDDGVYTAGTDVPNPEGVTGVLNAYDAFNKYANGTVTLVDTPSAAQTSTDGIYDYVVIDYSATAVLSEVTVKESTDMIRLGFEAYVNGAKAKLEMDTTDDTKVYTFVDTNGAEVDPATISSKAVLSIAYDVNSDAIGYDWTDSAFYNVVVSTNKVEGRVGSTYTNSDTGDVYFVIDGAEYKWVDNMYTALGTGKTYELCLDKNGDIARYELLASSINYAIIDMVYVDDVQGPMVSLILKDGSTQTYPLKDGVDNTGLGATAGAAYKDTMATALGNGDYTKRFVEYTVNKSGEVSLTVAPTIYKTGSLAEYSATTNRIGGYALADTSVILDAGSYVNDRTQSVGVTSLANLVDEEEYDTVFVGTRDTSTNVYPMAVIVKANDKITGNTRMVVAASELSTVEVDGAMVHQITIATSADETATIQAEIAAGSSKLSTVKEGDAFLYSVDSDGYVKDLVKVYSVDANKVALKAGNVADTDITLDFDAVTPGVQGIDIKGDAVTFHIYPVIKKYTNSVAVADGITQTSASMWRIADTGTLMNYDAEAVAYMYDGTVKKNHVEKLSAVGAIAQSTIPKAAYIANLTNGELTDINLQHGEVEIAYAVVRVCDGDILDIYSIVMN